MADAAHDNGAYDKSSIVHWRGWVDWFEDDGQTVVVRLQDQAENQPEQLAWIPRDQFSADDRNDLQLGTYIEWVIHKDGGKPTVLRLPPLTEAEIAEARERARELMKSLPSYDVTELVDFSEQSDGTIQIGPKPWRCYYCGHSKGLIESRESGLIECFCIPACDERRKSNAR